MIVCGTKFWIKLAKLVEVHLGVGKKLRDAGDFAFGAETAETAHVDGDV